MDILVFLSGAAVLVASGALYGTYLRLTGLPWREAWYSGLTLQLLAAAIVAGFLFLTTLLQISSQRGLL
ncbi:hypothetical protein [Thioalkalivibrio paradoxus]|uniref:Uncharacterized protein n=1 Tax=Thioalkalivibrio paradoxus ARh 1 TaxID=713585 RepID=W0DNV3_9GAMM|nr:hypothetical protein [Thioalkalivibrio paradoxus]AHF00142.1 hypothetical protein THITH_10275 [Thioalkalivibrio paradoxus ARh 1]